MGITINAENVGDALDKLQHRERHYGIKIRWRKGEPYAYGDTMLPGCIVDATGMPEQEVERSFDTASAALRYIASLLKVVEKRAKEQRIENQKRLRDHAKKEKEAKRGS